jgi:hypothetical protein
MRKMALLAYDPRGAVQNGVTQLLRLVAAVCFAAAIFVSTDQNMRLRKIWQPAKLLSLACFALLGLLAAYAFHGSGSDLAGTAFAGAWLGMLLLFTDPLVACAAGWFLAWAVLSLVLTNRLLEMGAWSVLTCCAALIAAFLAVLYAFAKVADDAYREDEEQAPTQTGDGWNRGLLLAGVVLACQAGGFAVEWQLAGDNVGADLLAGVVGFGLTIIVLKLISYLRGAEDRREEREYYSDDLDGTWIGREPDKAPQSPSVLT